MSAQSNPAITGLLVLIPIALTITIAFAAVKFTEFHVSTALTFLGGFQSHRADSPADSDRTLVDPADIELGRKICSSQSDTRSLKH